MLEYLQWIALLVNLPSRLHYIYLLVLWNQGMAALPYHILTPLAVHCSNSAALNAATVCTVRYNI